MLSGTDLDLAASLLKNGKIVVIPTETVYGIAANAFDVNAVIKIFNIKERPAFDPLIVHTYSIDQFERFACNIHPLVYKLAKHFSPGPLTYILDKKEIIPDIVTSGLNTVGIRIPRQELTLKLLKMLDFPLAAPSANKFGKLSPTHVSHVKKQLGNAIEYILEGGTSKIGIESTIIRIVDNRIFILRQGAITPKEIYKVVGKMPEVPETSGNIESPGQLKSHYSTNTRIVTGDVCKLLKENKNYRVGVLKFYEYCSGYDISLQKILSPRKNLSEAAFNLFKMLHELDELNLDLIIAELLPETGLGCAINDRLKRASAAH